MSRCICDADLDGQPTYLVTDYKGDTYDGCFSCAYPGREMPEVRIMVDYGHYIDVLDATGDPDVLRLIAF